MGAGIASHSKSGSSQDSLSGLVFTDVLEPDTHGYIRCESPTMTSSSYYDS